MPRAVCLAPLAALVVACAAPSRPSPPVAAPLAVPLVVPGSFEPGRQPDGNSVVFEGPDGLIVVDTGRHPAHVDALLAAARRAGQPIVAIVNTHWHLDHTGGNAELRAAYPDAAIVATTAVEGALADFFPKSAAATRAYLERGEATLAQQADLALDLDAMAHPEALRPTRPITASGPIVLAGRHLDAHVAAHAATAADLWLYDPASRTLVAGDLVVAFVPFFDTACVRGWRAALDELAAVPFERLVPGHGKVMTRADFLAWKAAFDALVDCAASARDDAACVTGWRHDAAAFIDAADGERVERMLRYYLESGLRAAETPERCGR
jgi:glyoxylase-like metal-dependent hydrolase (beta-lactamase superfamily II)